MTTTTARRGAGRLPSTPYLTEGTPLQLLVSHRMHELGTDGVPLSLNEVVARSAKRGQEPAFTRSTVHKILHGLSQKLTGRTLAGLARALEVSEDDLTAAMRQSTDVSLQLPPKLKSLTPQAWNELLEYGDFLLARDRRGRK